MRYRQCTLEKKINTGNIKQVTYLPEKYAIENNVVKLKNKKTQEWEGGWHVTKTGKLTDNPPDVNKMLRSHKKATGDSLPKRNCG